MAPDPAGVLPGTLDPLIMKAVSLRRLEGCGALLMCTALETRPEEV